MKKIAIIPARSGSKGLVNKNILMLGSKPLIAYTIEAALDSHQFERVIVSTDSLEYKYISEKYGAEVIIRNESLATDTATSFMVIEDILKNNNIECDYFVLLQPTSPFRSSIHIKESIELFEKNIEKFDFLVSMEESSKPSILIKKIDEDKSLKNYDIDFSGYSRQKYKEYYPNGAIFIGKVKEYLEKKHFFGERSIAYFMSREDSLDIDTKFDFEEAISILTRKNKEEILLNSIKAQIENKKENFNLDKEISLIGHSILNNWKVKEFKGKSVNNLGISGISTLQYKNLIIDKNKIKKLSEYVILMLGTNDIIDVSLSNEDIVNNIVNFIKDLRKINSSSKIYFLEIISVAFRMDRDKNRIFLLNSILKKRLKNYCEFVELNKYLTDDFRNLRLEYTSDGLHFSEEGYKALEKILKKEIRL